jgi:AcrR family transcriptional regulator
MVNSLVSVSTEEKIVQAARGVFFRKGLAGARMQDIADEAGINKAMLHYYFRSKEKLFEVIFREAFDTLIPRVEGIFQSELDFFDKIRALAGVYIQMGMENPYIPLFVLNQLHTDTSRFKKSFGSIARRIPLPQFRDEIEKAVKQGLIRSVEPHQLVMHIMSMCLFPFIARPMFQLVMQITDDQFMKMAEARMESVPEFIIQAIRK